MKIINRNKQEKKINNKTENFTIVNNFFWSNYIFIIYKKEKVYK